MQRFMHKIIILTVTLLTMTHSATARDAVPGFRFVATQDMDFYGSDLDALFDTDLPSCIQACASNTSCSAFTFNSRSGACFPKSTVSDKTPYTGALSAEKVPTNPRVLRKGATRAADLEFLGGRTIQQAYVQARDLGLLHRANGRDLKGALSAARGLVAAGNITQAMRWTGVAVSLSDRGDLWAEYARLLLAIKTDDSGRQAKYEQRAVNASVNAYLRGKGKGARVSALMIMSQALEQTRRGRAMIPALRLASSIQPRQGIDDALDVAIGKYGFRIAESMVESDSAAPRICAEFTDPLIKTGVDYETYVRLPDPSMVVQASGNQLCVDGVKHGERYRITFRRGLPAANGEVLHKDVELTHYVRDRSPSVRFPGRSYVLPKSADAALPVESVNLTKLDLRLRRVSDRNLLRAVQDGYFGRPLSQWQDQTFASEIAEEVWVGTADVSSELNRDMITRLPMGEAIAGQPAGIYALTARIPGADPYEDAGATQWFVLSDLGLSSMSGTDGLHVQVRGLSDAQTKAGIEVTLISRANAVLGQAVTDSDGYVVFEPGLTRGTGGSEPALVLAKQGDIDLGFLSLTDPGFDLSDRGVEGRTPAGPVDVFLTTDRGAYRAGETIYATVLARDTRANAIEGLPLTAILSRPDGVEYRRRVSDGGNVGGHVFAMPVGLSVPRGTWRLEIKSDPKGAALASRTILVEDFLPERIDFDMSLPDAPLRAGDSPLLSIDARYLFGAPGADLSIEGQLTLRAASEIAEWPGYRFGRYDAQGTSQGTYFGDTRTDARGKAVVALDLPVGLVEGQPLEALIVARLADGSARPVERRLTAPVRPAKPVIGIKPLFDDVVSEGSDAAFEVIGLRPDLTTTAMQVNWTLNRVERHYQWYQIYGNWNWEPTTRRTRIAKGTAMLGDTPLTLSQPVDWGRYELVIEREDGEYTSAAVDFYAGWYVSADASSTPDRLEMSLDRDKYQPGDTARLRIVSRNAGSAMITVMSNHVIERQAVSVAAGETVIPLQVTGDWGAGAYVSATVIRPMDVASGQNPARAMGIAHASVEQPGKRLAVSIDVPEVADPRQTERVRVTVTGAEEGQEVWLTLAAVDLGILNLTGFKSPDPKGHFYGQRRLGMELRDVYGRLIDGMNGAMGVVRSGGDEANGQNLQSPPPTQELMSTFSGPVRVGAGGAAFVNIDLPAFNGTVRLMAVAWSGKAVGQGEIDMLVRDPVVVTASLPRFLAPGDSSRIRLDIVHADGPTGQMQLAVSAVGTGLTLGANFSTGPASFTLTDGGKATFEIPVLAGIVGDPSVEIKLTTPDGRTLTQVVNLSVRANDPVVALTRRFSLGAGNSFLLSKDVFAGLRKGTGRAIVSAGPLAKFDAPGLLAALDHYPYGCTEQVTSKAMPLLYLASVAEASGLGNGPAVQARIDAAIAKVLTRQASNGAFGLWRADSGDFWLDAYTSDFLSRARAEGHIVPDQAFRLAMDNLRNQVNYSPDFDSGGADIAYAMMVLAREGAAAMGDLRYYVDVKGGAFDTPLAAAQMGAALASYGDQVRADEMFRRASVLIAGQRDDKPYWRADYGTHLRDVAGVLALAAEAGSDVIDQVSYSNRLSRAGSRLSTQESAWTLMAAQALIKSPEQSGLRVNGAPVKGPFVQVLEDDEALQALEITMANGRDTDITLTTIGVPEVAPAAGGTGYTIERRYYTMEGKPIETMKFTVGERFVTVLVVKPHEDYGARLMIDDPLPAGVEIDNPNMLRSGDIRALDWLKPSFTQHTEFRSDRFLAAVDSTGNSQVTLAYVARAVTPGEFHHPAASVEDMYRPRFRARTDTGRVIVSE
ncbi:MAG: alpha-2-macroglobulin family protein [Rhodobacteraceae bacterium]|nr:alpha-2-macroglobulin family protein [Paracoccaceae bacterium]